MDKVKSPQFHEGDVGSVFRLVEPVLVPFVFNEERAYQIVARPTKAAAKAK